MWCVKVNATAPLMRSNPTMTTQVRVCLLLSDDAVTGTVPSDATTKICETLSGTFGVTDVVLRSAATPVDKLVREGRSNDASDNTTLFVLLTTADGNAEKQWLVKALESDSCNPVLVVSYCNNNNNNNNSSSEDDGSVNKTALRIAKFCSLGSATVQSNVAAYLHKTRQNRFVRDAQIRTNSPRYLQAIARCYDQQLQLTQQAQGVDGLTVHKGKVRDSYGSDSSSRLVLVTTDRQSGFDRQLAVVPFKGAVLNLTSAFWFEQTKHIIPNHLLDVPHPNVTVCKKCKPFPIEFVMRSYMTGSTSTSIWHNYHNKGLRNYCGHDLQDGMKKNEKLPRNLLTPTTKEEDHDRPISAADIVKEGWMTQQDLDVCSKAAQAVFQLGQDIAAQHGLILVDTKYEFGRDPATGQILLIDEVHTPDSSRYWLASTYAERIAQNKEPDNIDKEFLRLWFKKHCDPYGDESLPDAPRDLVLELSKRYVMLYELITWKDFELVTTEDTDVTIDSIVQKEFGK